MVFISRFDYYRRKESNIHHHQKVFFTKSFLIIKKVTLKDFYTYYYFLGYQILIIQSIEILKTTSFFHFQINCFLPIYHYFLKIFIQYYFCVLDLSLEN